VVPAQKVKFHSVGYVLRHVVYSKLKKIGFSPVQFLKSGKGFGGGMVKNGLDTPDSVRDYMLFFSKYPVLQRAFLAAFMACLTVPFLVALKDGLLKIVKKDKRQDGEM